MYSSCASLRACGRYHNLREQQRVMLLRLLNVDGQRLRRPDTLSCRKISFDQIHDSRQSVVALYANVRKRRKLSTRIVTGGQSRLQHACAFKQLQAVVSVRERKPISGRRAELLQVSASTGQFAQATHSPSRRAAPSPTVCSTLLRFLSTQSPKPSVFSSSRAVSNSNVGAVGGKTGSEVIGSFANGAMISFSISLGAHAWSAAQSNGHQSVR